MPRKKLIDISVGEVTEKYGKVTSKSIFNSDGRKAVSLFCERGMINDYANVRINLK